MEFFISQTAMLSEQAIEFAWFPVLIWTLLAGLAWFGLGLSKRIYPAYHCRARLALVFGLPAGLLFLALVRRVNFFFFPGSTPEQISLLSFSPPADWSGFAVTYAESANPAAYPLQELIYAGTGLIVLSGFLFLMIRFTVQWLRLHRLKKRFDFTPVPKSDRISRENRALAASHSKPIGVAFSPNTAVPVTFGFRRPVILLPDALRYDNEKINLSVHHELIHITQKDFIIHSSVLITQMLFWFHPLIHLFKKELIEYREMLCDALVLESGSVNRKTYASLLLELMTAPVSNREHSVSISMAQESSNLKKRIEMITQNEQIKPAPQRSSIGLFSAVILCTSLAMTFTGIRPDTVIYQNDPITLENVTVTENEDYQEFTFLMADPSDFEKNAEVRQKMNALDNEKIISVNVYKDEMALEKFGEPGRHGVVVVRTSQSERSYQEALKLLEMEDQGLNDPPNETIDSDIKKPELIEGKREVQTSIRYPREARRAGIEGVLKVQFIVTENGVVENPEIVNALGGGLDEEVLREIKKLRFKPAMKDGEAVRSEFEIPFLFRLMDGTPGEDPSEYVPEGGFAIFAYGGTGNENRRNGW
jgi:TonB family protein